jgi:hypothetical protein
MTLEIWALVGAVSFLALVGLVLLWWRMPVYRWYCRRCKRIVSSSRFHPGKCPCGTNALVAYFCETCASWNTSPTSSWHCNDCSSRAVVLGVEYQLANGLWTLRNRGA